MMKDLALVPEGTTVPVRAEEMLDGDLCILGESEKVFRLWKPSSALPVSPRRLADTNLHCDLLHLEAALLAPHP